MKTATDLDLAHAGAGILLLNATIGTAETATERTIVAIGMQREMILDVGEMMDDAMSAWRSEGTGITRSDGPQVKIETRVLNDLQQETKKLARMGRRQLTVGPTARRRRNRLGWIHMSPHLLRRVSWVAKVLMASWMASRLGRKE